MGKYCQLVMGPAGTGKSSYCSAMAEHCTTIGRTVHVVNLDPAAEDFKYSPSIDIRNLISVDDTSDELNLGPNGGLIFCMEFLLNNINWFEDQIGDFADDYLILDCPGQIELYIHLPIMKRLCEKLEDWGYKICGVYLLDSLFITDATRFLAGVLSCISAMIRLELPHINLLSKCDLLGSRESGWEDKLGYYLNPEPKLILNDVMKKLSPKYERLTFAIADMIDSNNMVAFIPCDIEDKERIELILAHVDQALQYGEDEEVKIRDFEGPDENYEPDSFLR